MDNSNKHVEKIIKSNVVTFKTLEQSPHEKHENHDTTERHHSSNPSDAKLAKLLNSLKEYKDSISKDGDDTDFVFGETLGGKRTVNVNKSRSDYYDKLFANKTKEA